MDQKSIPQLCSSTQLQLKMGVESAYTIAPNYSGKASKNGLEWRGKMEWSGVEYEWSRCSGV